MEHSNADGRINNVNDQATPDINLVGFWSVYPEFTWINCVQQASISTWISLSTFAKWQHSYVCYYLLGGDTVVPSRLYGRFCHAFLLSFFFLNLSEAISGSTWPIFTIFFHQMEGICVNVVNLDQFFSIPQGTLPWQPILDKLAKWP